MDQLTDRATNRNNRHCMIHFCVSGLHTSLVKNVIVCRTNLSDTNTTFPAALMPGVACLIGHSLIVELQQLICKQSVYFMCSM